MAKHTKLELIQKKQVKALLKSFCLVEAPVNIDTCLADWLMKMGLGSIVHDYGCMAADKNIEGLVANKLISQFWFQAQLNAIKEIVGLLNKKNIVPVLLKGISISISHYPQPYYRMMGDIDILVNEEKVNDVEYTLSALGYKQKSIYSEDFYKRLHHTMPWQHCKDDVWIEVHKKLFPKTSACYSSPIFQLDVIKSEMCVGDFYGGKVYRLSKEFQIVYIASHWAERFKQIGGIFALTDVALIINKYNDDIDWNKVISWSNTPYISNYVYLLLQYLSENGLLKSSINIEKHTKYLNHTLGATSKVTLNSIINNYFLIGKPFGRILTVNNIAIIWKHLLQPKSDVIKFLLLPAAIIFPKGSENKFNFSFQLSRLKALLNLRKE